MARTRTTTTLLQEKVIAIVRLRDSTRVLDVVRAIHAGGVRCIEITLNTPGALASITAANEQLPDVVIGAGTVCTVEQAEKALGAGARFLVTPVTLPELIPVAHRSGAPVVMGAFTPTEMYSAARAGADFIKLFPASTVGPDYLRSILAPLPELRVMPTGGVDADNAAEWLRAGAVGIGVGGALTDPSLIAAGRFDEISRHARNLMLSVR